MASGLLEEIMLSFKQAQLLLIGSLCFLIGNVVIWFLYGAWLWWIGAL